jgi:hypothetical protein
MNWKAELDQDLQNSPSLKDIPDVKTLAKSFVDNMAHIGASIRIPGKDAGDEDKKAFYAKLTAAAPNLIPKPDDADPVAQDTLWKALGKPGAHDKYTLPEGIAVPDDVLATMRANAFDSGLTNRQFQAQAKLVAKKLDEVKSGEAKLVADLKAHFGQAYDDRMAKIRTYLTQTNAPADLKKAFETGAVSKDLAEYMSTIVASVSGKETSIIDNSNTGGKLTPAEAQVKIDEINRNPQHPYWVNNDPGHQRAVDDMYLYMSAVVNK